MAAPTQKSAANQIDRRRRRHPRFRGNFRVTASYLEGNKYQKIDGHCRDLSEAGIGIILATELKGGEVVGLKFSIPESTLAWEVRAVVRYRRGYHYGFEFLSLTGEQQELLNNYLKTLPLLD